jgi:Leucine-rich repeat (LRR) protein
MFISNQQGIPPAIYCLRHLQKLDIRNTSFSDSDQRLPAAIERFSSSLTRLSIFDTMITQLPVQIGKLSHLQRLELSNTGLISLPNVIGKLLSLTELLLPNNNLKTLPPTIKHLRSLKTIDLSNNPHLSSIQELNGLPSLGILNAQHCSIKSLPRNLPNLTDLYMTNNNLTVLTGIETLGTGTTDEKSFYFGENQISTIPPEIAKVNNLHRLNMNGNQLNNLPANIYSITTLRYFHIKNNRFDTNELTRIKMKFAKKKLNVEISC